MELPVQVQHFIIILPPPSAAAGTKFLYLRTNWAKNVTFTVSQTINGTLPAGYYRISCKAYTFENETSSFGLSIQDGNNTPVTSSYTTANSSWQPWSVVIYKSDVSTSLTIAATMTPGGDGSGHNYGMLLDDFQLEYSAEEPAAGDMGVYYLYNQYNDYGANDRNRFLARGKDNGTRAVVDRYGIPVRFIYQDNGSVKMQFADGSNGYVKSTWYLDTDGTENYANTFKIVESTVDGVEGYHFATQEVSSDLSAMQYMYVRLYNNEPEHYYAVAGNAQNNVANDYTRTVWKLLTPAERNAIIAEYPGESLTSVIAQAGNLYSTLPPAETPASQYGYWIEAEYTAVNVTPGTWIGSGTPGIGDAAGTTELYQKTGTFTQTLTGLQNGIYRIALQAFERHGSTDNAKQMGADYGNIGAAYMTANGQQVHIAAWDEEYTGTNNPNSMAEAAARFNNGHYVNEVFAYVSDGTLTISVTEPGYLAMNWFIMKDALTITYFSPTKKTVATPIGEYYLYNLGTRKYMTFDGYWGTYYSMSDVGKRLTLETSSDGFTLMHTTYLSNTDDVDSSHDTENYFYSYSGRKEHAFSNGNSHEGGEKWVFYQVGESDGKPIYNIMNFMTDYYLSGEEGYDTTNDSPGWGGKLKSTAADNDQTIQWQLVTKADLLAELQSIGNNESKDASFLIDEPDLIAGFNNVYKEFYSWKVMGSDQTKYSDWNTDNITTFYFDNTNGTSEGNSTYAYCAASDYPDILQTITGIPNGLYVVECQAVFRDGNSGNGTGSETSSSRTNWARLQDKTYVNRAYLYANDNLGTEPTDARDKRDRYWIYKNAQMMPVNVAKDAYFGVNDGLLTAFKNQQHTVQIPIYVTTGKLTIGVLQEIGINENLLVFDRFRLTYYGENVAAAKEIAKNNLLRLQSDYSNYQSNTITAREKAKLDEAINAIDGDYTAENVAKYNKVAQDYGETSINWYIYKVLQDDYDRGDYTTAAPNNNREQSTARYPFVDEASKKQVVKYFGVKEGANNNINYFPGQTQATYSADSKFGSSTNMKANGELSDLRDAISAIRTYVAANAEARYVEDEKVKDGALEDTEEARRIARETRMALVTGREDAITTEDGRKPAYDTNPLMFDNTGAIITAPDLNKIVHNARCWAPRDAYDHSVATGNRDGNDEHRDANGYRFYDYTNYYYWGEEENSYTINIEGLMTGKYLVTISESHNNQMDYVRLNAYVGTGETKKQIVTNKDLFRTDQSVWQTYTHSWQDVSCVVDIKDQFEPVELTFTGKGKVTIVDGREVGGGTMNICNLRIYRMEDVQMILFDEDATILAKNGMDLGNNEKGYNAVKALLRRSMAKNQWNTLVLPVDLTKEQVIAGFGEGTILATMDGFSEDYGQPDNCIHFTTDDLSKKGDNAQVIQEGKVYLIKPTADPAVSSEEQVYFKNSYEHRNAYEPVNGPIYYLDYVNYRVTEGEKNPAEGQGEKVAHAAPSSELNPAYNGIGKQKDKLSLQMQGRYGKNVVPVDNGGTNYIYAFQQQSDDNVYLVELDPSKNKNYTLANDGIEGTGRLFKGYRGWAVANYTETPPTGARQSYLVLLDEGDNQLTVIRGIDSEEGYSEVKIPRQGVYDLQGRSIDRKEFYSGSYPQGVYIVDGKKVVRK